MHFPPPAESGGRVRTRSHHERDDARESVTTPSAIQVEGTTPNEARGGGDRDRRENGDAAPAGGSVASAAGDLDHVVIDPSTASSSLCPAIIAPTVPPSALAAAAAAFSAPSAGGDSFLGFGFESPPKDVWEDEGAGGEGRGGGRLRAPSSDNVDLGGGCDLGWGELDADAGLASNSRDRGSRDGEDDEGYAFDAEGRPASVPDIDPHWSYDGAIGGQTRSARARSSSFYEGDDEDMMACINGEAPATKSSSGSSVVDSNDNPSRYGSLAYSSSGDFSTSAELDALLRPRNNSCGMTASQAAAAKSAAVVVAAAAAAAAAGEVACATIPLTPVAAGRRQLGKRELDALEAGLKAPVPGCRKYSNGDDDRDLSSESDEGFEDDEEGYYEEDGEDQDEEAVYSGRREQDGDAFYPAEEGRISPVEGGFRHGGDLAAAPGSPPPRMEVPGPLTYHGDGGVAEDGIDKARRSSEGGGDIGGIVTSDSVSSLQSLGGGHVYPPGVDPFLSGTGSDGSGRLPLSPRAVMMSSGMTTETATAAAAAAFPVAVPLSLPPPHSPPRPRVSLVTGGAGGSNSNSNEQNPPVVKIPSPRHPPPVLWPPAEGTASTPPAVVSEADAEARGLACGPGAGSPGSLCSPPVMLASLSLSAAPPSPHPHPSVDEQISLQTLIASPPAPPPAQLAPLPPPPEPLAPSPPRPPTPTPDAPSSEAPSPTDDGHSSEGGESDRGAASSSSLPYDASDEGRGSSCRESGPVGSGSAAGSGSTGGQVNPHMPPPPPPTLRSSSFYGSSSGGNGGGGAGAGCRIGPAGPGSGSFGSGGSAGGFGTNCRSNPSGSFISGGSGGGGGISRLMGPGGPFRSNRSGAGGGGDPAPRARYRSGGGGGNGRSNLYGSAPGTLGDGSARRDHVLRGSSAVQGFLSVGGGNRNFGSRRGHGGAQQAKKIKLLMLGDSGVGKSSLMDRFTEDYFNVTKVQTLGVDFKLKTIVINDEEVDLQVWDTAGQQKFHKITQAYYRGSHGIVLVYDISDPETLDNTAYWMKSIRDTPGSNRVQICLVGNKVDLRQEAGQDGRQSDEMVKTGAGRKVAEEFGAEYFECSAKTGCMVEEAFTATATKAYEAHLVKPSTPSSKSRRRLGRRRHNRTASIGSDRDRPPRSDASWSTSSSLSGVESSADRLDNARIRQCSSDTGSENSTTSVVCHTSVVSSSSAGGAAGGPHPRQMSFSSSYAVVTPSTSSCSSPNPTPFSQSTQSTLVTTPPRGSCPGAQQQQGPQQRAEVVVRQQPSPPSAGGQGEQQRQQQQQRQQPQRQQPQIRELVPTLSALSPKTAAAALGMGAGKGAAEKTAGEDSPTGTGTMSPLPGQQRSIGRSSSLGDMESYFNTTLTSPKGSDNDSNADGGTRTGAARRRADTGGLFGLFGGGGGGATGFSSSGGSLSSDGDDHNGSTNNRGSGSLGVAEIIARQRQRQWSSPRPTAGQGPWGDDPPPPAVSRMKGKKPPRVPRTRRMASGDSDGGGARGRGGKNVCKVS